MGGWKLPRAAEGVSLLQLDAGRKMLLMAVAMVVVVFGRNLRSDLRLTGFGSNERASDQTPSRQEPTKFLTSDRSVSDIIDTGQSSHVMLDWNFPTLQDRRYIVSQMQSRKKNPHR